MKYMRKLLLLSLTFLAFVGLLFAQGTTLGTVRGTVSDTQGGVIPGAKVRLTDLTTNLSVEVTTNQEGNYEAPNLRPGEYKITVSQTGFNTTEVVNVVVRGSALTRADAQISPRRVAEVVTVTAEAPAIQIETPTVGATIGNREILELPRDSRDIYNFLYLNPNITTSADGGGFKFLGAQSYGANFSLDGLRANGGIFGEPTASQPSLETIGELTVLSNNFTAEYAGISNIRVSTKRGGKEYHGSVFHTNKNSALAAWNIRDKIQQAGFVPTPARDRFETPYFNLNETGASFSGPVPGGRKKTFFLGSYERRWSAAPVTFSSRTLPHPSLWAGDFSRVNDSAKPTVPAAVTLTPEEMANNTILVGTTRRFRSIPQRLLNPSTQALIKNYFPQVSVNAPINAANGRLVDFYQNVGGLVVRDLGTFRLDHDLSEKDRIYGVYNIHSNNQATSAVVNPFVGLGLTQNERNNHTASLSHNRIIRPNLINEARGGVNYQFSFRRSNTTATSFLKSIGWDDSDIAAYAAVVGQEALKTYGHLGVSFQNTFVTFGTGGRNTFRPLDQKLITFGDTLTWIRGRHSFKMGADLVRNSALDGFANNRGNPRGLVNYTGTSTNPFTSFLLGLPPANVQFVGGLRPPMDVFNWEHGYYLQDDFKIRPKVTLYLGLRYELITPFIEANDLLANFDPSFTGSGGKRGRFIIPSEKTLQLLDPRIVAFGVAMAKDAGVGRGLVKTDRNNFAPRLGLAWQVAKKTVLRGGYGFFYPTAAAQGMRDAIATNPFNQGRRKRSTTTPLRGWPGATHGFTPFTDGVLDSIGTQPSANAVPVDLASPRIEQFNATFERELPWKMAIRASYLGTRMHGLIGGIDNNLIPPSDTPFGTTTGDGVTACTPSDFDCQLSPADLARLPFPALGDYLASYINLGDGRAHALQIEANRRMTGGLMFNISYTLLDQQTEVLDTANSSLGGTTYNQFRPGNDFSRDSFVSRHRVIAYGIWQVPLGRGQRFGASMPKPAEWVLGGWQASWNMFAKSGTGFTPYWQCTTCGPPLPGNIFSTFIDAVGSFNTSSTFRPLVTADPHRKSGDRIWDPSVFAPPSVGADVLDNPSVARRNSLRGPGSWGANLGINKSFLLREGMRLSLRAEFNKVFNHPLLSPYAQEFAYLGDFQFRVNATTRRIEPISASDITFRNPDFGRVNNSFSQENIDSRRTVRLTLRLTF